MDVMQGSVRITRMGAPIELTPQRVSRGGRFRKNSPQPDMSSGLDRRRFIMFRLLIATLLAAFAFAAQASVDVNKASQAELQTIKGIGPSLSTKILVARKTGDFKSWADMVDRVSGVGPGNAP